MTSRARSSCPHDKSCFASKRMRKVPTQNASSPEDKKEEIETALKLTEEVKTETEDKPIPTEEEKK